MMKPLDRSLLTSSPQSLAGRTVILHLLPLSINELAGEGIRFDSFAEYAFQGFLPRICDQAQRPSAAYSNYYRTFENLVVIECMKARYNRGESADLWFFRDSNGNEVDLVWREGGALAAAEIKAAPTFSMSLLKGLGRFREVVPRFARGGLFYSGDSHDLSDGTAVRNFREAANWFLT